MARILVIDDSLSVLELVESILCNAGHEVFTANSGKQGASILASEPLDLVITDIYMPDQDGLEVIRQVHRMRTGLRVLAVSSATEKSGLLRIAKALGAAGTLPKPFAIWELLDAVDTCLQGCTMPDERRTSA